jgi:replication initiation and membrane attachment protein DnaB
MGTNALSIDAYVVDTLLPDMIGHDKRPAAFALYLWLFAMTRGSGREGAFFSYATLIDRTGLSKSSVQRAVAWLERRELVRVRKASATSTPEYTVLTPWRRAATGNASSSGNATLQLAAKRKKAPSR